MHVALLVIASALKQLEVSDVVVLCCFICQTFPLACTPAFDDLKQQVDSLLRSNISMLQRTRLTCLQVLSANAEHDDKSTKQLTFLTSMPSTRIPGMPKAGPFL